MTMAATNPGAVATTAVGSDSTASREVVVAAGAMSAATSESSSANHGDNIVVPSPVTDASINHSSLEAELK